MYSLIWDFFNKSFFYLLCYAVLIVIITTDEFITKKNKRIFLIAILLGISNILLSYIGIVASSNTNHLLLQEIVSYTGYSLRPFLMLCFLKLSMPQKKHYFFYVLSFINLIMYCTTHYTHLCVYYTENNSFKRGPLWFVVFMICGLALFIMSAHSLWIYRRQSIRRRILPLLCSLLILFAVTADVNSHDGNLFPSYLNQSIPIVMLLFYLFYHLLLAEQYEDEVLHNQQLQLMISQIKPHFFFNTITTIQALCNIDPKKASDTLRIFADYVRQNITFQTNHLIPFDEEIQHVKTYTEIEMLRFPNIDVQYELPFTDFDIATLSIQPLVENAIKHGIRSREQGIVLIRTEMKDKAIEITIKDNGIGFDTQTLEKLDDTHIGIRNVKSRLKNLQNAHLEIESNQDGTCITITIPWEN